MPWSLPQFIKSATIKKVAVKAHVVYDAQLVFGPLHHFFEEFFWLRLIVSFWLLLVIFGRSAKPGLAKPAFLSRLFFGFAFGRRKFGD